MEAGIIGSTNFSTKSLNPSENSDIIKKKDIYDLTILHPGITHQGREQVGPDSTYPYIFSEGRSWDLLILTPMVSTNVALKTHLSETS